MEGVCAYAARAWHADNLPTLPVDGPRTFRTLRTLSVSRRRSFMLDGKHALQSTLRCSGSSIAARAPRSQAMRHVVSHYHQKAHATYENIHAACYHLFLS